ncbi:MFS transporter [Aurantivibrio plasticivorans]
MKSYFLFVKHSWAVLLFGFLAVFWGNFGQSFFVGQFSEAIQSSLGLSAAEYGSTYSLATLLSAMTVVWAGSLVDRLQLRHYVAIVCVGLSVACLLLSQVQVAALLVIALYFLRLFGQALLPHAGSTTMARVFDTHRGKALSIASSGFPVGEIILPALAVVLIATVGWQHAFMAIGVWVLIVVLPSMLMLIQYSDIERLDDAQKGTHSSGNDSAVRTAAIQKKGIRALLLRDYRYWLALPGLMAGPFIATGIFIHQNFLLDSKGWSAALFATCFIVYGVVHWVSSLVSGVLVDRFSAHRLLPYFLIPLVCALATILFGDGDWSAIVFMALLAMSIGGGSPITGALWAEIYGAQSIGAIRSVNIAIIVFATSLSPILLGYFIDQATNLSTIVIATISYATIAIVMLYFSYPANPYPSSTKT